MTHDGLQGMLFGSLDTDPETGRDAPTGAAATAKLRLCTLNVNSPGPQRAQQIADWLLSTRSNALILTEMQPSDGSRLIMSCLEAEGFTVTCAPGWQHSRYLAVIATRDLTATRLHSPAFDPRVIAVDLTGRPGHNSANSGGDTAVRLVGVYGLTNGMTEESSHRRRAFQQHLVTYLAGIAHPRMVLAGDLNVIEPGHRPHLPAFAEHDYAFYTALLNLGLIDAYRTAQPTGTDHSWINDRYGAQRIDHTLVSAATGQITTCHYDHQPRARTITDHAAMITHIRLAVSVDL